MVNDNSPQDNWGTTPGDQTYWTNGRVTITRECDGVFCLEAGGVLVMPPNSFDRVSAYLWAEFDVMEAPHADS